MLPWRGPLILLLCAWLLAGCERPPAPAAVVVAPEANIPSTPAQAVQTLSRHLRDNDLEAFARDAVPPSLHRQLEAAWRDGRTRWPLQELPFDKRLPGLMATLAAPDAPEHLRGTFERQFAGQGGPIHSAVSSLGVFGARYLQDQGDFSADERAHYTQLVVTVSAWARKAPLDDRVRAQQAIATLTDAARRSGLGSVDAFRALGMATSLRRMGRFQGVFKQALRAYGLDLDASLDGLRASLQQQTGDTATVRMRYRLDDQPVDALVSLQRVDGRWYLTDYLRHARAAVASEAAVATAAP
ncbi:MAG TPA: hypothetical protein VKM00_06820 [Luteimonas sp.]|nr:hypothetical protein [Luteimonas sp.]